MIMESYNTTKNRSIVLILHRNKTAVCILSNEWVTKEYVGGKKVGMMGDEARSE